MIRYCWSIFHKTQSTLEIAELFNLKLAWKRYFSVFGRKDSSGNPVTEGEMEGLLLYRGGTVCDSTSYSSSYFDDNSAEAICRLLGYSSQSSWSSRSKWEIQNNYDIKMRKVRCSNGDWSSCTYSTSSLQYCDHSEDIFLTCTGKRRFKDNGNALLKFNLRFPSTKPWWMSGLRIAATTNNTFR